MIKKLHVVLCLGLTTVGFAQQKADSTKVQQLDEVVISDSRFALKRENSGKTVIKISSEELKQNAGRAVSEIINTKSGITVNGSYGQSGNTLSTFSRGGQNRQVLVIIDGIAVNDPSQIESNFDLNLLSLEQIESIEILKGASSALYGNRASTAVINITLKKASKAKMAATFSSFMGTNNEQNNSNFDIAEFTNAVNVNGTLGDFSYLVNFSNAYADGLSAIREEEGAAPNEHDVFSKYTSNVKLSYKVTENLDVAAYASLDNYKTEYDNSFLFADDNNLSKNKQYRFGVAPEFNYENGSVAVNVGLNSTEREFQSDYPAQFDANSLVIDAFNKYKFNTWLYTIVGVNYIKSEMNNTDDFTTITEEVANDENIDPYASVTYVSDFGLNINAGGRLNNHSEYGSHFVYNINPSYTFKFNDNSFKLLGAYSTAFITPSLYQLFVPYYGNTELQPQEDTTIEAGFETSLFNKSLRFSAVYFNRDQANFIDFVILDYTTYESEYQNVADEFKVTGLEVELNYKPFEELQFNANYAFTERKDDIIFRVPKHKVNASLGYQLCDKTFMLVNYQYTGKRTSPIYEPDFRTRRTLESFSLVNFNINHKVLNDKLQLFASVSNIFDEDYEELYRYSTRGRNYKFGIRLNF